MDIPQYHFADSITLYNLGDVHRGSRNCDVSLWNKTIERVRNDDSAYWASTGDLLEVATKHSKSSVYHAMNVQDEIDTISEELAPIRHKCLGFVASNHHNRVDKESGISLDRSLAAHAGIPYLGISGVINITVDRCSYYICLHHGAGGSGTEGNAVNRAIKTAGNFVGADLYLSGHTHKYSATPQVAQCIDRKRGLIRDLLSWTVVTGHFLRWKGSYGEQAALKPAPLGAAFVTLGGHVAGNERNKSIVPGFYVG